MAKITFTKEKLIPILMDAIGVDNIVLEALAERFRDKAKEFKQAVGEKERYEKSFLRWYLESAIGYETVKHINSHLVYNPMVYGSDATAITEVIDEAYEFVEEYPHWDLKQMVPIVGNCKSIFLGQDYLGGCDTYNYYFEFRREYFLLETGKIAICDVRVLKERTQNVTPDVYVIRYAKGSIGAFCGQVADCNLGWIQKFFNQGFQDLFETDHDYYDLVIITPK